MYGILCLTIDRDVGKNKYYVRNERMLEGENVSSNFSTPILHIVLLSLPPLRRVRVYNYPLLSSTRWVRYFPIICVWMIQVFVSHFQLIDL